MLFSSLFTFTALCAVALAQSQFMVPVPWYISKITIGNIRHGTGGYWSMSILDTPTVAPQGFNTTCYYWYGGTYIFALDGAPTNAPCANTNVTFGLFPNANHEFTLNVTHLYGDCGTPGSPKACVDNGTWSFSWDDVRGQEVDVQNNFGQAGGFYREGVSMYPTRAIASSKCEFC
ncbi:hypothetical protein B0J14DRAFT_509938 [Halenospora varia]|nr:hypothetical protein B0J14DRAFT_509938 [Halenospora varia]